MIRTSTWVLTVTALVGIVGVTTWWAPQGHSQDPTAPTLVNSLTPAVPPANTSTPPVAAPVGPAVTSPSIPPASPVAPTAPQTPSNTPPRPSGTPFVDGPGPGSIVPDPAPGVAPSGAGDRPLPLSRETGTPSGGAPGYDPFQPSVAPVGSGISGGYPGGSPATSPTDSHQITTHIIRVRFVSPNGIAEVLRSLIPESAHKIAADPQSNSVIFRATPREIEEFLKIVNVLDSASPTKSPAPTPYSEIGFSADVAGGIQATPREEIEAARRQYEAADLAARELGRVLQQAGRDPVREEALRTRVREAFTARQRLLRVELVEMQRRMIAIQESIDLRDRVATQIIERRVIELSVPGVQWEPVPRQSAVPRTGSPVGLPGPARLPAAGIPGLGSTLTPQPKTNPQSSPASRPSGSLSENPAPTAGPPGAGFGLSVPRTDVTPATPPGTDPLDSPPPVTTRVQF